MQKGLLFFLNLLLLVLTIQIIIGLPILKVCSRPFFPIECMKPDKGLFHLRTWRGGWNGHLHQPHLQYFYFSLPLPQNESTQGGKLSKFGDTLAESSLPHYFCFHTPLPSGCQVEQPSDLQVSNLEHRLFNAPIVKQ